jgi:hypothetical protein
LKLKLFKRFSLNQVTDSALPSLCRRQNKFD